MSARTIRVVSAVEMKSTPVRMIAVELRHNGQRRDLVLDDEIRQGTVEFADSDGSADVEYRYRAHLHATHEGRLSEFESPSRTTDASTIVVDPRESYRTVVLRASAVFDFSLWRAAFVDFHVGEAGNADVVTMQLHDGSRDNQHWLVRPVNEPSGIKVRIRHVAKSGEVIDGQWQDFDGTTVIVSNPAAA